MTYANDNIPVTDTERKPEKQFRLTINEHDSWSGPDRFYRFYYTLEEAVKDKQKLLEDQYADRLANAGKPTPKYYTTIGSIHRVITVDGETLVGKALG